MTRNEVSIQILRKVVVDFFLIFGLVACMLTTRYLLQPFQRGFFCGDESLMFPYKGDTVSVLVLRLFGLLLPAVTFLICEWALLRKEKDEEYCLRMRLPAWLRGFYCALVSFCLGYCFVELATDIAKFTIGRPRPHFFDLCKPSVDCNSESWRGRNMRMSFLSGHSSSAAYAMVFLALYLQQRMSWSGTRVLRHVLQFGALMLSWFTALSRVSDYKHHWSDVLAGYALGASVAVITWFWCTDLIQKQRKHSVVSQHEVHLESHQMTLSA
ncbi:hypothetical protein ACJJTC_018130 [Scirpophaga incertulas]